MQANKLKGGRFVLLLAIGLSALTLGALSTYALQSREHMSQGMMREGTPHGMMHEGMMKQMMEGRKEIEEIGARLKADLARFSHELS